MSRNKRNRTIEEQLKAALLGIAASVVLLLALPQTTQAATNQNPTPDKKVTAKAKISDPQAPNRKSVGLVLSGGGAKGAAQLRIIKAIEEAGIPIDYIAGTSIGSIIGGLYSVGYTVEEIEELFVSMDWFDVFTDRHDRSQQLFSHKQKDDTYMFDVALEMDNISMPSGIVSGDRFMDQLNELLLGYQEMESFDDLPIPFACVSYDMNTGSEYVSRSGNLSTAIRASMSIPGVFKPVRLNDMVLVDGGVYNNFPVDVVREMGADIVIGIDLSDGIRTDKDVENMVIIFEQLTTFLGRDKFEANKADCDYYMHPEIAPYSSASFSSEAVDSLIMRGQREADAHRIGLQELRKKIGLPKGYKPPQRTRHYSDMTKLYIGAIRFEGFSPSERRLIDQYLNLKPYSTVTRKEFNQHMAEVRTSGGFDFITYSLANRAPYDLVIGVNERNNAQLHVGFRFDSHELASVIVGAEMTLRHNRFRPTIGITSRLSQCPYVELSASSSRIFFGNFTFAYKYQYSDYTLHQNGLRAHATSFDNHALSMRFSDIYLRNFNLSIGADYELFDFHQSSYTEGGKVVEAEPEGYINYGVGGHYESLDDLYLPRDGWSINANYALHTNNGIQVHDHAPFASLYYNVLGAFTPSWCDKLTIIPNLYGRTLIGMEVTYAYRNYVGGVLPGRHIAQQMPFVGMNGMEMMKHSVMIGSLEARVELFKNNYLSLIGNYLTQDDDFRRMFRFDDTLLGVGLKYTYNTPLGPISVLASGSNINPLGGLYFSFGKNF